MCMMTYRATNATGATEKTDTLKFKDMFSFLIGLQTTKARLLCVNVTCDRLINVGWPRLSSLHCKMVIICALFQIIVAKGQTYWCQTATFLLS